MGVGSAIDGQNQGREGKEDWAMEVRRTWESRAMRPWWEPQPHQPKAHSTCTHAGLSLLIGSQDARESPVLSQLWLPLGHCGADRGQR